MYWCWLNSLLVLAQGLVFVECSDRVFRLFLCLFFATSWLCMASGPGVVRLEGRILFPGRIVGALFP